MTSATFYPFVTLLHLAADIVFVSGLLVVSLLVLALSFHSSRELARERRLIDGVRHWNRLVTTPALVLAWGFGLWLTLAVGWLGASWLTFKLILVAALSAQHGVLTVVLRRAAALPPVTPPRATRAAAPLMLVAVASIVWLVLLKPG